MSRTLSVSRSFDGFAGNGAVVERACALFDAGIFPHTTLITGEDGCGRNAFALMCAQAYLEDTRELVARGQHPDCVVMEGSGASGDIAVDTVREASYELNKAPVMNDNRRVGIIRNASSLNKYSANALLKILEQPPDGVIFILTAARESDVIETVLSRGSIIRLGPAGYESCYEYLIKRFSGLDETRARMLCRMYGGRIGLAVKALSDPGRLAVCDCAQRLCGAFETGDKLGMLKELECASDRTQMKNLLSDAAEILRSELEEEPGRFQKTEKLSLALRQALKDIDKNANLKLLAAKLTARC